MKHLRGKDKKSVKTIVCTTPIRPIPTDFYPMASMLIVGSLRKAGYSDTKLYNIDLNRPSFDEVIEHFKRERPDVVGISAVVSTAYDYVKKLSLKLKEILPETIVVLGGNLGASAEIILNKTGVDFVCTGEGEKAIVDLYNHLIEPNSTDTDLKNVLGWAYLDNQKNFVFTGYPEALAKDQLYDVDWTILEENNELDSFLLPLSKSKVRSLTDNFDERLERLENSDKKFFIIVASKGCVARCTFCHRWDKGIRYIPIPVLMKRIDHIIEKYNVGFVSFGDENFGTDKKWLGEFLEEISKRDVLWRVAGMRVNCITEEWMVRMKEAGCVQILYGMESGSPRILKIMEKMTTLEQNKRTLELMVKHNIPTTIQLVLGMPGESPETVRETAEFAAFATTLSPDRDPNDISINYAQALPGTPLYEHARRKGHIGKSLNDEEEYLLLISDRDARDGETTLNFTEYPRLEYDCWHLYIQQLARVTYIKKWGIKSYKEIVLKAPRFKNIANENKNELGSDNGDSGYFASPARDNEIIDEALLGPKKVQVVSSETSSNIAQEEYIALTYPSLLHLLKNRKFGQVAVFYPRLIWTFRSFLWVMALVSGINKYDKKMLVSMLKEYVLWRCKKLVGLSKVDKLFQYDSLRRLLKKDKEGEIPTDPEGMKIIRLGR